MKRRHPRYQTEVGVSSAPTLSVRGTLARIRTGMAPNSVMLWNGDKNLGLEVDEYDIRNLVVTTSKLESLHTLYHPNQKSATDVTEAICDLERYLFLFPEGVALGQGINISVLL